MLSFAAPYEKEVFSFGLTVIFAVIVWVVQARPRIIWGFSYGFRHSLQMPPNEQGEPQLPVSVSVTSYVVSNVGRKQATNVEVTLSRFPDNLSIWPHRPYEIRPTPEGASVISIANLPPRANFGVNILQLHGDPPTVLNVESETSLGKELPLAPLRLNPTWFNIVLMTLLFLGVAAMIYLFAELIGWLATLSAGDVKSTSTS